LLVLTEVGWFFLLARVDLPSKRERVLLTYKGVARAYSIIIISSRGGIYMIKLSDAKRVSYFVSLLVVDEEKGWKRVRTDKKRRNDEKHRAAHCIKCVVLCCTHDEMGREFFSRKTRRDGLDDSFSETCEPFFCFVLFCFFLLSRLVVLFLSLFLADALRLLHSHLDSRNIQLLLLPPLVSTPPTPFVLKYSGGCCCRRCCCFISTS